jgi:hypothetical protein
MRHILAIAGSVLLVGLPQIALAQDADNDGVADVEDNCVVVWNPPPFNCDTDEDGYGNLCDGDFNQDHIVSAIDFVQRFWPDFLPSPPASNCWGSDCLTSGGTNVALDGTNMDCSADGPAYTGTYQTSQWPMGSVTAADAALWWNIFIGSGLPGPSGLSCAGTPSCCVVPSGSTTNSCP